MVPESNHRVILSQHEGTAKVLVSGTKVLATLGAIVAMVSTTLAVVNA
jgi:hypothetical protein